MFERFVEEAVRSVLAARDEARRFSHAYVGTEHLLLGVALNDRKFEGLLARAGKSVGDLRVAVGKAGPRAGREMPADLPFSSDAQKTISVAWSIAEEFHHNTIVPLHMLLGILRIDSPQARQVLQALDVDAAALLENTREALTPTKLPADRSGYQEEELEIHTPYGPVILSVLRLPSQRRDEARIISIAANGLNGPQEASSFISDLDRLLDASSSAITVSFFRDLFLGLGNRLEAYLQTDS